MLDTTVFNHLIDRDIVPSSVPSHLPLFVTHVQRDEILNNVPGSERLSALLAKFTAIDFTRTSTSSGVWNVSEWNESGWGKDDGLFESLLEKLNKKNKFKHNNERDILIAETAIRQNLVLVTDDRHLSEVAGDAGGKVLSLSQFLLEHKAP